MKRRKKKASTKSNNNNNNNNPPSPSIVPLSRAKKNAINNNNNNNNNINVFPNTTMIQDVMLVGEPTLMGGELGEEDERVISRLENSQYRAPDSDEQLDNKPLTNLPPFNNINNNSTSISNINNASSQVTSNVIGEGNKTANNVNNNTNTKAISIKSDTFFDNSKNNNSNINKS